MVVAVTQDTDTSGEIQNPLAVLRMDPNAFGFGGERLAETERRDQINLRGIDVPAIKIPYLLDGERLGFFDRKKMC